jgi:Predicted transcriptional regulators
LSNFDNKEVKFCDYLRQRRELLGLAQKDIAEALSVDVPMYSRYERGQRPLKEEHIPIIATKLDVDSSDLRKMWIADKVLSVVNSEKDVTAILNIVAESINDSKFSNDGI